MSDRSMKPCPGRCHESAGAEGVSRRGVLRLACVVSAGVAACGNPAVTQPTGPIAAGNVKDVPAGTFRVMGEVVLARDGGGLYALSAVCTHAGCPTVANGGGLFCPCHGSRFDQDGNVTRGPARQALPHFQVDLASDGAITVQASTVVSSDTRTPVA
jgi:nitrite reductase/ring-hydroxylating ferredoxin subunit